jgi:hypothetical protein
MVFCQQSATAEKRSVIGTTCGVGGYRPRSRADPVGQRLGFIRRSHNFRHQLSACFAGQRGSDQRGADTLPPCHHRTPGVQFRRSRRVDGRCDRMLAGAGLGARGGCRVSAHARRLAVPRATVLCCPCRLSAGGSSACLDDTEPHLVDHPSADRQCLPAADGLGLPGGPRGFELVRPLPVARLVSQPCRHRCDGYLRMRRARIHGLPEATLRLTLRQARAALRWLGGV